MLDALDTLDRWPEKVRLMQRNWIGRSEGALRFTFDPATTPAGEPSSSLHDPARYALRRTFMAIAADHPLTQAAAAKNQNLAEFIAD